MAGVKGVFPGVTATYLTFLGKKWARSGVGFGAAGFLAVTFFCDWKDVLQNVPVFNYKFKKIE